LSMRGATCAGSANTGLWCIFQDFFNMYTKMGWLLAKHHNKFHISAVLLFQMAIYWLSWLGRSIL
jgi:hypothetical protein